MRVRMVVQYCLDAQQCVTRFCLQDNPLVRLGPQRALPILSLDEWEHSYYLVG
jgi:superoxide dismutase